MDYSVEEARRMKREQKQLRRLTKQPERIRVFLMFGMCIKVHLCLRRPTHQPRRGLIMCKKYIRLHLCLRRLSRQRIRVLIMYGRCIKHLCLRRLSRQRICVLIMYGRCIKHLCLHRAFRRRPHAWPMSAPCKQERLSHALINTFKLKKDFTYD